jgi:tryptophan 7-halogenase
MPTATGRIADIVVAGSGLTGWSAAAALKRQIPWSSVTIIATPAAPGAFADRIASTLPSITGFHADLGLREDDTVVRAGSGFRLGTRFSRWCGDRADYIHAYGHYGRPFGTASFHHHWVRASQSGAAAPFDRHCAAAMLGRVDAFVRPHNDADGLFADFEYGLHIDPHGYGVMMRAFALHCGVQEQKANLANVTLREDGFIGSLMLEDGKAITADLFVDCTGPAATLRTAINQSWEDWTPWLPCDRVRFAEGPPDPESPSIDDVTAHHAGWSWRSFGPKRTSCGLVYATSNMTEAEADTIVPGTPITIAAGTRPQPWRGNCVALGDAATVIEPLEWTNLHMVHSAIDRIVEMLPDHDCAPIETNDYNRQCYDEATRIRDFAVMHYATANRSEPFWQKFASTELPASLTHTLIQFRSRGRLPFYEEETFAKDSWLAVLLGQGVVPSRADPLIDPFPPAQSDQAMAGFRDALSAAVARQPKHAAFLQNFTRQVIP